MKRRLLAISVLAVMAAAPAWSEPGQVMSVVFLQDAGQHVALKGATARAYAPDDTPLFEAGIDYIRDYAENPAGRVYEWDAIAQRVRITPDGHETVWLKCAELKPMSIACGSRLQVQGALIFVGEGDIPERFRPAPPKPGDGPYGSVSHGSGKGHGRGYAAPPGPGRGVPLCPGDARCRKVKRP